MVASFIQVVVMSAIVGYSARLKTYPKVGHRIRRPMVLDMQGAVGKAARRALHP